MEIKDKLVEAIVKGIQEKKGQDITIADLRGIDGNICGRMAILAEGDAQERTDLIYLEKLPVFNAKGEIIG